MQEDAFIEENNMESLLLEKIIPALWWIPKKIYLLFKKFYKWHKKRNPTRYTCELYKENISELKGGIIRITLNQKVYIITEGTFKHFSQYRIISNIKIDQNTNSPIDIIEGKDILNKGDISINKNNQAVLTKESMLDILKKFYSFDEKKRILYLKKSLFSDINKKLRKGSIHICIKFTDDRLKWINSFADLDNHSFNSDEFDINISIQK